MRGHILLSFMSLRGLPNKAIVEAFLLLTEYESPAWLN